MEDFEVIRDLDGTTEDAGISSQGTEAVSDGENTQSTSGAGAEFEKIAELENIAQQENAGKTDKKAKKERGKDKPQLNAEQKLMASRKRQKRRRAVRRAVIWIIVLAAVVFGLYAYNFYLQNGRWPWKEEVVQAERTTAQTTVYRSTYTTEIDISGSVTAYDTQAAKIRAEGAVTGVYVKEGDRVKKGQLLAEIDSTSQDYNVANIEWQIEKAKITGTTSQKDLQLLEMQLESAKQKLENTKVYANFDGVVVSVSIEEGDYFEAGSGVMTIIDDSRLKATVEVDEIDVQMLEKGMKASLTSDAVPGVTIEAVVDYIPMIGRYTSQGIGVMDVEIVIENPPAGLKPGFSFEGVIAIESEQSMLLVSQSAVTTNRGVSTVTKLLDDGSMETVVVQIKYLGENLYQILSGDVREGDSLVYSLTGTGIEGLMNSLSRGNQSSFGPGNGGFGGGMR